MRREWGVVTALSTWWGIMELVNLIQKKKKSDTNTNQYISSFKFTDHVFSKHPVCAKNHARSGGKQ